MSVARVMMAVGVAAVVCGVGLARGQGEEGAPVRPLVVRGSMYEAAAMSVRVVPVVEGQAVPSAVGQVSYTAVPDPATRKFKKNGLVTVIVREDSNSTSTGKGDMEKKTDFDLALQQMAQVQIPSSGVPYLTTVGNPSKLPEVKFKYDNKRTNNAALVRADSLAWRIEATIVDVKPNGTLVIEATKEITQDGELQKFRLSGVCRSEDITIDNTVLSTQLAELKVGKDTAGEVRDGMKAGWLGRFIDKVSPF